jgi:hypothetical protein
MKKLILLFLLAIQGIFATCTTPCKDTQFFATNGATGTTPAMNNTGATALIVLGSCFSQDCSGITITSSPGNTFTCLTSLSGATSSAILCYALTPIVSSSQTVSYSGCSVGCGVFAMSLTGTGALDGSPGFVSHLDSGGTVSSFQPGSISTSQSNSVVISGMGGYCTSSFGIISIDSSYTIGVSQCLATAMDGGIAYKVISAAGATNPTWSITSANWQNAAGYNIAFLAAATSTASQPNILGIL